MPLFNDESAYPVVVDAIKAAGGSISHNDLVNKLQAAGQDAAAKSLLAFAQGGMIKAQVKAGGDGPALLTYSMP